MQRIRFLLLTTALLSVSVSGLILESSVAGPPRRTKKCASECQENCSCGVNSGVTTGVISLPIQPMRVSPLLGQLKPDRVLIITPLDRQDRLKEQRVFMGQLAGQLRAKSGLDVIESPRHVCEATFPIRTGQFDERKLVELGKKYSVDTVLYCNVESIDAYCPMRLEIQFLAVNVEQSVAILSGSQHFDLSDPLTLNLFFQTFNADPLVDTTYKNSPSRLIDFGAAHLAGDLTRLWK